VPTRSIDLPPRCGPPALGVRGWPALLYVAYSAFLGGERARRRLPDSAGMVMLAHLTG